MAGWPRGSGTPHLLAWRVATYRVIGQKASGRNEIASDRATYRYRFPCAPYHDTFTRTAAFTTALRLASLYHAFPTYAHSTTPPLPLPYALPHTRRRAPLRAAGCRTRAHFTH